MSYGILISIRKDYLRSDFGCSGNLTRRRLRRVAYVPIFETRYRPRKLEAPKTVATWPVTALRPGVPTETTAFPEGRTATLCKPRCSSSASSLYDMMSCILLRLGLCGRQYAWPTSEKSKPLFSISEPDYSKQAMDPDERIALAAELLVQSPPGEINDVLNGVSDLPTPFVQPTMRMCYRYPHHHRRRCSPPKRGSRRS
jgi:hypothetical protein